MAIENVVLRDPASGSVAEIAPSLGFNCHRFAVPHGKELVEVLWRDPNFLDGTSKPSRSGVPVLFPFPGMQNDKSIRLSTFVDAGMIGDTYSFSQARASAGIAVSYVSPFGPLKLSFAQPVRSQAGDKQQKIQFQFGQQF